MSATPDGFELTFTKEVDRDTAADVASYKMPIWSYKYYDRYGDDQQDPHEIKVTAAKVSADGRSVRLVIDGCKPYYVHHLQAPGVRSADGVPLLHNEAYYTLNRIPAK